MKPHDLYNEIFNPEELRAGGGIVRAQIDANLVFNVGESVVIDAAGKPHYTISGIIERRPARGDWKTPRKDFIKFAIVNQ